MLGVRVLAITILVATAAVSVACAQDCPCGPAGKDGPLTRLIPQEFKGADFRPACRAHDACYDSPGADKRCCDARFLDDLICACNQSTHPVLCRIVARNMARATRWGGGKAFQRAQGGQ